MINGHKSKNRELIGNNAAKLGCASAVVRLPVGVDPVIRKPVSRIFEISDSNPIGGEYGKRRGPPHPRRTRV